MPALLSKQCFTLLAFACLMFIFYCTWINSKVKESTAFLPAINYSEILHRNRNYLKHEVKFVKNPASICAGNKTNGTLVVVIPSKFDNFERRQAIRATWANDKRIVTVFLVGMNESVELSLDLDEEFNKHDDIIQANFIDSYQNLTLKSMVLLTWTLKYCNNMKYVLKCDDDVFIDVTKLWRSLDDMNDPEIMAGRYLTHGYVVRDASSKWYVSEHAYPESRWPTYLIGSIYLMRTSILNKLFQTCLDFVHIPIEDSVITGLCTRNAGIILKEMGLFFVYPEEDKYMCRNASIARLNVNSDEMILLQNRVCSSLLKPLLLLLCLLIVIFISCIYAHRLRHKYNLETNCTVSET